MGVLGWLAVIIGAFIAFFLVEGIYLSMVLKWETEQTLGLAYYGRPLAERRAFKRSLARHARLLAPILRLSRGNRFDFRRVSFRYRDVAAPLGSTTPESFARAERYEPRPDDVFVATQMKCGTTWMEHVVYEVLHRGAGTLVTTGTALYAVAPWLEGVKSVPLDRAPTLGSERPSRIIKTHLPAGLCPRSPAARFIYVARHPASCFASSVDFVVRNTGGMAAGIALFEEWFCSPELMWWGTWTDHVAGWWRRAATDQNVLFVHFEAMKRDLPGVVREVAAFLGVRPLSDAELAQVVEKCGFDYMQTHQEMFEMFPPHILQTSGELFVRGSADRHQDVPADVRERITAWAERGTRDSGFPWLYGRTER
jgi:hypothetical protein